MTVQERNPKAPTRHSGAPQANPESSGGAGENFEVQGPVRTAGLDSGSACGRPE
jgi:hypothetical protein